MRRGVRGACWIVGLGAGVALACGESVHHASPGAAGRNSATAGTGATPGPRCTELVDDGAPLTPQCPVSAGCPTWPTCTFCEDCATKAGIGAPLVDGTYELADVTVTNSACGSFEQTTASGVLVVDGATLSLSWTRPYALGATAANTATYSYSIDGDALLVSETCPDTSEPERVSYASANGVIYFSSQLPGEVAFSSVFVLR